MTSTPVGSSGPKRPDRSLTSRTSLLTAAAIAGVLLAGTAAVAANIGILNAADSSAIGDLAATDELLPTAGAAMTPTTDAPSGPSTAVTMPSAGTAQQYDISGAGTVWVMTTTSGVALDHVVAEPGWAAALAQGDPSSLQVSFTNGARTIVFTASIGSDGALVVDVTEPTTVLSETPAAAVAVPTTAARYDDDDDVQYGEDDDEQEYEEHEGAEDDD